MLKDSENPLVTHGDRQTSDSAGPIRFSIDEPLDNQRIEAGEIPVVGWAFGEAGEVAVSARVANQSWRSISWGKARRDIENAYPEHPDAGRSGFSGTINAQGLKTGAHWCEIRFRSGSDTVTVNRRVLVAEPSTAGREAVKNFADDGLRVQLQQPVAGTVLLRGSVLRVGGWALSKAGVKAVQVFVDGDGPFPAHHGLIIEELEARHPEYVDPSHGGFLWAWPTSSLRPGKHCIRVVCTSRSGRSAEVEAEFEMESRSEYQTWYELSAPGLQQRKRLLDAWQGLTNVSRISIVTPVYRTPEKFLRACIESVQRQTYWNWEHILVDDASGDERLSTLLKLYTDADRRIQVIQLDRNHGIAGATNAGIAACSGELVGFLDHDDELSSDALFRIAEQIDCDPSLDVLYCDEDKIDERGHHVDGFFKPDWSPDLLLSMNYVCHFLVCRRTLLNEVGGLRLGFDGSQDHDLVLRLSEATDKIKRIPRVLYHWRIHQQSTASGVGVKPEATSAGRRAVEEHLKRRGISAAVRETGPGRYSVEYQLVGTPKVAIVIPTGGSPTLVAALESLASGTTYKNFEVVVVDNSKADRVGEMMAQFKGKLQNLRYVDCRNQPFNFSALCNRGVAAVPDAGYVLFLNDDTEVITPDWLEVMLRHAQREQVGAVGAKLLFPNRTIQHAGVVLGLWEFAGHPFRGLQDQPYYFDHTHAVRNCAAVTGACLLMRRDVFDAVGGFEEEHLPTCFQDVDICLKAIERGLRVVWTPEAKLFHFESFSKKTVVLPGELKYMTERWGDWIKDDRYYSPNLARHTDDYSVRFEHLFLPNSNEPCVVSEIDTPASKQLRARGPVEVKVEVSRADSETLRRTKLSWKVSGAKKLHVRADSPTGALVYEGWSSSSTVLGAWARSGKHLYILDASDADWGNPEKIIAVVRL